MYIKIHCVDYVSDKETVEICEFRGIRYDRRTDCAVLSTEHDNHDYVFPVSEPHYESLIGEIEQAIRTKANMISLDNGSVFRCKKGQLRREAFQDKMSVGV